MAIIVDAIGLIDVIDRDDAGVIQCRSRFGFLDEPALPLGI